MKISLNHFMSFFGFLSVRPLNYLTATTEDLLTLLEVGAVTSEHIVAAYLNRIDRDNHQGLFLRAVIETAPKDHVIQYARQCDLERQHGVIRGPLHGIPILVKDSIATDPSLGMNTTAGSFGLRIFSTLVTDGSWISCSERCDRDR